MGESAVSRLACHFWVLNNPSLFDPVLVDIFSSPPLRHSVTHADISDSKFNLVQTGK